MTLDSPPAGRPHALGEARRLTVEALCEHFASDALDVEEFERRIDTAHRAVSVAELEALLADLRGGAGPVDLSAPRAEAPARTSYGAAGPDAVRERALQIACLGGVRRAGRWTPARTNYAVAVCGGAEMDFREALFGPGVTEVQVFVLWGGPTLRVTGAAVMGGVEVTVRYPGESPREARRRRRATGKERRRLLRSE